MGRIFAREIGGRWYRIAVYRDESGKRRQKSLGRLSDDDARRLLAAGGQTIADEEVINWKVQDGQEAPEPEYEPGEYSTAEIFEVYREAMRDLSDVVLSNLCPRYPAFGRRFREVAEALRACDRLVNELHPGVWRD